MLRRGSFGAFLLALGVMRAVVLCWYVLSFGRSVASGLPSLALSVGVLLSASALASPGLSSRLSSLVPTWSLCVSLLSGVVIVRPVAVLCRCLLQAGRKKRVKKQKSRRLPSFLCDECPNDVSSEYLSLLYDVPSWVFIHENSSLLRV